MLSKVPGVVFTFLSTTDAMAAENLLKKDGIKGRTIPVPRSISASCGISWCTSPGHKDEVTECLRSENINPEGIFEIMVPKRALSRIKEDEI